MLQSLQCSCSFITWNTATSIYVVTRAQTAEKLEQNRQHPMEGEIKIERSSLSLRGLTEDKSITFDWLLA
jgi:hypothetical protein